MKHLAHLGMVRAALVAAAFVAHTSDGTAQTLVGAIDFHAHGDPDGTARKVDVIDLARAAKAAGMRAIVIKNHYEPTASLAYVVRREVPGIEVFGGISLDLTVGGVNPAAVEWMTKVKGGYGKVVWLPTFDSEAQVLRDKRQAPFASVVRNGQILPEVLQVIGLAAKHDLVLETGHSSPQESLLLIAEAKRQGVKHVLVTHAMTNPGGPMSLEEMRQAAQLGAMLELVYSPLTDSQLQQEAEAIRTIGAASFVLSSDLGQPQNPLHTDGLLAMYKGLMAKGVAASDIDVMSRKNPARLLGLEPFPASSAQSNDDAVRQLAGMWRLVSNPQRLTDGTTRQGANGVTATGYAFFDAAGRHMCYITMTPNRPLWKSGNAPTPDEAMTAFRGINSYCASLEIHAKEGFMDRRYDINQNPNQVGRITRRWFSFQAPDRLTLRVDDAELNKPVVETLFVWERVKD